MFGTGQPGPLRLFQSGLAAQVSWLMPFGLIMIAGMAASVSWRRPHTALHRGLILWGGWLLTCVVFFSVAGFFHQYYLAMMGPPLAAIVAIGLSFLWRLRRTHPTHAALLLLAAAGVTLAFQVYAVRMYMTNSWWVAVPVALGVAGLGLLFAGLRRQWPVLQRSSFAAVAAALLVVPSVWSGLTTAYANEGGSMPQAYGATDGIGRPAFARRTTSTAGQSGSTASNTPPVTGGTPGDFGGRVNQTLLNYLQAHTQGIKYLVVVPSSQAGAEYVLATGRPVLYAGGFSGSDPVIDGEQLAQLVAKGEVRYVLWGGGGPGGRAGSTGTSISSYLQSSCRVVDDASLGTATGGVAGQTGGVPGGFRGGQGTLYQCGS
jgi:4-amino-4-deoxy-L-arabinose transferase-like glycosyltransferase